MVVYNLQDDVKGSFVWVSEKLIFKVKGDRERVCFQVHWFIEVKRALIM